VAFSQENDGGIVKNNIFVYPKTIPQSRQAVTAPFAQGSRWFVQLSKPLLIIEVCQ
jgi:hypothetical protein